LHQRKTSDLRQLLRNYPVGNRSSSEIDEQINLLRDEYSRVAVTSWHGYE